MFDRILWELWHCSHGAEQNRSNIYSERINPWKESCSLFKRANQTSEPTNCATLMVHSSSICIKYACSSSGCAWRCSEKVVELFHLTTLKCQTELLAVWLYADLDYRFSAEHLGAFRSVKGRGPTIKNKTKEKEKKPIWNKIKLWSFLTTHLCLHFSLFIGFVN